MVSPKIKEMLYVGTGFSAISLTLKYFVLTSSKYADQLVQLGVDPAVYIQSLPKMFLLGIVIIGLEYGLVRWALDKTKLLKW